MVTEPTDLELRWGWTGGDYSHCVGGGVSGERQVDLHRENTGSRMLEKPFWLTRRGEEEREREGRGRERERDGQIGQGYSERPLPARRGHQGQFQGAGLRRDERRGQGRRKGTGAQRECRWRRDLGVA